MKTSNGVYEAMSVSTDHKDIQLLDCNADKDNMNARTRITTEDMCITRRAAAADGDVESCKSSRWQVSA